MIDRSQDANRWAICIDPGAYEMDLSRWKVYQVLPDADAESLRHYRVVDESGEDYLYPQEYFTIIELPNDVAQLLLAAGRASP